MPTRLQIKLLRGEVSTKGSDNQPIGKIEKRFYNPILPAGKRAAEMSSP